MSDKRPDPRKALVVLDVDHVQGAFELVLVNLGTDTAHDIRVDFSRRVIGAGDTVVTDLPVFQRLRTLRPGKELRVFVDSAVALFRRRKSNVFGSVVTWRDARGEAHKASYRHDLDAYRGFPERLQPRQSGTEAEQTIP